MDSVDLKTKSENIRSNLQQDIQKTVDEASTLVITDSRGIITYVNEKFCEISKYSEKELLGNSTRMLKSNHHAPEFYSNMWEIISSGKTWKGAIKNKAKDGSHYWVKTTITPSFDEKQNIQNYISMRVDITSQVDIAEKLHKVNQLATIGELASRMSHDIRNPLTIIRVTFENLKIMYGVDEHKQKQYDKLDRSINRITHQIDDVLDFVRKQPIEMNSTKFSEILTGSLDSLNIPNNIKLIIPENDVKLFCNKKRFSVALNNLIFNGIQAIDGAGTIEITCEENNDAVVIQVKDSGSGIPQENKDKIFEPLFTTKQQGTGLGLASVKSIIDSHGGIISITSPPTIFTITLPKIQD